MVKVFLVAENNAKNVETKFHGRKVSTIDKVIKRINVNLFAFLGHFLLSQFLLFYPDSTYHKYRPTQKVMTCMI